MDNNLEIYESRPAMSVRVRTLQASLICKKLYLNSMITWRSSRHISASGSEKFMFGYLKLS